MSDDHKGKCHAHRKKDGNLCGRDAMKGQRVCRLHGGLSPQALRGARDRINDLVDPSLNELAKIINEPGTPPATKLAAIRDVLDRAGYGAKQQVELQAGTTFTLNLPDMKEQAGA